MAFQTKDFLSIVAGMVNRLRATTTDLTDFNVGAVNRVMMEAPAVEIDACYEQVRVGLKEAIPTATYTSFNFAREDARAAVGTVRVLLTAAGTARTIVAGSTLLQVGGAQMSFRATADAPVPIGATQADVPAMCATAGVVGNLPSGTAFAMDAPPEGFLSASALGRFQYGRDRETADAQMLRFHAYLDSLGRSSEGSIEYGLRQQTFLLDADGEKTERVASVVIVRPWEVDPNEPPGQLRAYIHNGVNGASPDLLARAALVLRGYRGADGVKVLGYKAGGVPVSLFASPEQAVPLTGSIKVAPWIAVGEQEEAIRLLVRDALADSIVGLEIGAPCIHAALVKAAMAVPGVVDFTTTAPVAGSTTTPAGTTKLMPGAITLALTR